MFINWGISADAMGNEELVKVTEPQTSRKTLSQEI